MSVNAIYLSFILLLPMVLTSSTAFAPLMSDHLNMSYEAVRIHDASNPEALVNGTTVVNTYVDVTNNGSHLFISGTIRLTSSTIEVYHPNGTLRQLVAEGLVLFSSSSRDYVNASGIYEADFTEIIDLKSGDLVLRSFTADIRDVDTILYFQEFDDLWYTYNILDPTWGPRRSYFFLHEYSWLERGQKLVHWSGGLNFHYNYSEIASYENHHAMHLELTWYGYDNFPNFNYTHSYLFFVENGLLARHTGAYAQNYNGYKYTVDTTIMLQDFNTIISSHILPENQLSGTSSPAFQVQLLSTFWIALLGATLTYRRYLRGNKQE